RSTSAVQLPTLQVQEPGLTLVHFSCQCSIIKIFSSRLNFLLYSMEMESSQAERVEKETGRVEAFSDGVFAIAITLLVLNLKIPPPDGQGNLSQTLLAQWPSFLGFLNSFITILIIWINHHNLFNHIRRTNNVFMLFNGLLLLCVTFLP